MISVKLVDHMGTDLSVVNSARISFAKIKTQFDASDEKLVKYLAGHGHWTPFGHTAVTVHLKIPVFVARQLGKHQVGFVWNEVSRRYVDSAPEFFTPPTWRARAEKAKQGSVENSNIQFDISGHLERSLETYAAMLEAGIAPEMARMVLPQNMMTEVYWTGSLFAFARMFRLRAESDAQLETRMVALAIGNICRELFPVSWAALTA